MNQIERISSGIAGFDTLMHGGIIKNSVSSVVGSSGTGKTTFALAYMYQGLLEGDHILYLSFEETPSKLLSEAQSIGINLEEFTNTGENLIHLVESERIIEFMTDILPNLTKRLKSQFVKHTRIILDPLTPILWEFPSEKEQRKVLTKTYQYLSSLGTVLQTVEEPNAFGQTDIGAGETRVPIYLSDSVIHIQNLGLGGKYSRTCKIIKSRKTPHYEGIYPLEFVNGIGIAIDTSSINNQNKILQTKREEALITIRKLAKDKNPKKQMIAEIATNLLSRVDNQNNDHKFELIKSLTDLEMLQEVR